MQYTDLLPRHVEDLMDKKGGTEAANRLKKNLSQLCAIAPKRYGFKGQNPARLADNRKTRKGGFYPWTDGEIAAYRGRHQIGSKARLAMEVFFCTGASRQDAAGLSRANIRDGRSSSRNGKTGQVVDFPILPKLAAELAHLRSD